MRLAPGLDSTKLSKALQGLDKYRILDVDNIIQMWPKFKEDSGWFADAKEHERFVRRLKHMTSVACCLGSQPGWIWYDFLWDVPHRDRHNRPFDSWHIKLGDQDMRARQRRSLLMLGDGGGGGGGGSGGGAAAVQRVEDWQSAMYSWP